MPVVIPDAGPWITLAHGDALELLALPGWPVWMVDMVLEELTRSETPTSSRITEWIRSRDIPVVPSEVCCKAAGRRQRNLGEMAIQEMMQTFALGDPPRRGIFLFEDHKIARASFLLPPGCLRVTTRAWLHLPGTPAADCFGPCDRTAGDPGGTSVFQTAFPAGLSCGP